MTNVSLTLKDAEGNLSALTKVSIAWTQAASQRAAGLYTSGDNTAPDIDTLTAAYPTQPSIRSDYVGWSSGVSTKIKSSPASVKLLQIEKQTGTSNLFTDMIKGSQDAAFAIDMQRYEALGKPVVYCVNNEIDGRIDNNFNNIPPGTTAAQHVALMAHLHDVVWKPLGLKNVRLGNWLAGYLSASVTQAFMLDPALMPDFVVDPYFKGDHPATETATVTWGKAFTNAEGANAGKYVRHIGETGVVNNGKFSPAQAVTWLGTVPQACIDFDVKSWIYFWDNRDLPYIWADASVIAALQNAVAKTITG